MHVKTHPPVTVLYSTHRTTISQLAQFVGTIAKDLCAEAVQHNALISGPIIWIYHGLDGKPDTVFTLDIAIPVQGEFTPTRFALKQLPAFKALTHNHEGPWTDLPLAYGQLMQHVDNNKIPLTEESREVYYNIDLRHPQYNITQLQIGVV